MNPLPFLRPVAKGVAWESLRLPGEVELRREVERRPQLVKVIRRWCDPRQAPDATVRVLAGSLLKADARITPAVERVGRILGEVLELGTAVELFLAPGAPWVAEVLTGGEPAGMRLALGGPALDRLSVRELLFCAGRKAGRVLLQQWPMLGDPTTDCRRPDADRLLLRGLWRFQELSCDRIGLVCCQDAGIAARAILKSTTGLSSELLRIDLDALLADRPVEEEAIVSDDLFEFSVLRCAALVEFARSEKFARALGSGPSDLAIAASSAASAGASGPSVEPHPSAARHRQRVSIVSESLAALAARDAEPQFADYPFRVGEPVEVQLDGKWLSGAVRAIEPSGDLRICFTEDGDLLRLSPTADLIRPVRALLAG